MTSYPYYDYKKDFPSGNGWIESQYDIKYKGEIIDSPNYIFKSGKYKNKSLQYIVEYCWRGLIKYIDYGLIFITCNCLNQLKCSSNKLTQIRVACDSKLKFCRIYDGNDEIFTNPYPCTYQGELLIDVIKKDPLYISLLFNRAIYPHYGEYQRYYADDHAHSIFGDKITKELKRILDHLSKKIGSCEGVAKLESLYEQLLEDERIYEDELNARWQEQMDRNIIEEGYREAFNDDPEAVWNID